MHDGDEITIARRVAALLLSRPWTRSEILAQLDAIARPDMGETLEVIVDLLTTPTFAYPPSLAHVADLILRAVEDEEDTKGDDAGEEGVRWLAEVFDIPKPILDAPLFAPIARFADLEIPHLATSGEIARWLSVSIPHLDWFADANRQHRRTAIPILQNYTYGFPQKRSGTRRLIEAPKPRLRTIQRRILYAILNQVPTHEAVHGFVRGRSAVTAAQEHVGKAIVVSFDLADFFPMTAVGRVHALFRSLGYPHAAAQCLTGLCTTSTPTWVLQHMPAPRFEKTQLEMYEVRRLAQGAPTSPALANLVAWRLDKRLAGLAQAFDATYTRYADDLTFSGDEAFAHKTASLTAAVSEIVETEGYRLNASKTRYMRASQRQSVTGIVVNQRPNLARSDYEALKAMLHNCVRTGPRSQNLSGHVDFRAHLEGRIGWVAHLHPERGHKLRAIFARIAW